AFAWHQDKDQVAIALFDARGKVLQDPLVIGKGRWPRLAVDGQRTAVAWEQGKDSKVRIHTGAAWLDEVALTGEEPAIAFAPGGFLYAATTAGLWQLDDQSF